MEASAKRRSIIKTVLIIFLTVMLILTFFSNTIMNRSLPEVAAQYTQSGSITAKLRVTANAEANSKHKITIEESRKVKSVVARDGQNVEIGDVLFYLDDGESAELKAARQQLASLEREYLLATMKLGEDFYQDELNIKKKQEELDAAVAKLNGYTENGGSILELRADKKELEDEIKANNKLIETYNREIGKLEGGSAGASLTGESTEVRLAAAKTRYDAALTDFEKCESAKDTAEAARDAAKKAYDLAKKDYDSVTSGGADLEAIDEQIAELEKSMRRKKEDFDLAVEKLIEELEVLDDLWNDAYNYFREVEAHYNSGLIEEVTFAEMKAARDKAEAAEAAYKSRKAELQPQIDSMTLSYERGLEDDTAVLEKLQSQRKKLAGAESAITAFEAAEKKFNEASAELEYANESYNDAQSELTESKSEYESLVSLSTIEAHEVILEELQKKGEELSERLEKVNDELSEVGGDLTEKEQTELVEALTEELAGLKHAYSRRLAQAGIDAKVAELDLADLTENLEKQRELVKKYEENSTDAKVVADIAGQVANLTVTTGSETSVGQTLCEIIVTELGYSCEVPVTTEQSRRIRVGDTVEITNLWWSDVKGTITSLRNDPKNPGTQKIAVISLTGEIYEGQSLQLTIGEKGQTYDTIVPNSAIREDNNGKFVLVVEAKSTPLGNRYTARRYDVEVLASDDVNSAVSGLMGSEFIITTSSTPITNGNQVRLSEN